MTARRERTGSADEVWLRMYRRRAGS